MYKSTRGSGLVSFEEALLKGLAPDGGLYLPEQIPRFSLTATTTLADLGIAALESWLDGSINKADLDRIMQEALNFPKTYGYSSCFMALRGPSKILAHVLWPG
jgi:threonine synthase